MEALHLLRVQTDAAAHLLQHLFMHQMHHRGQVQVGGIGLRPGSGATFSDLELTLT